MNPPDQPDTSPPTTPPIKARVPDVGIGDQGPGIRDQFRNPDPRPPIPGPPPRRLQTAVLAAFLVGMVALAAWGFLSRRDAGSPQVADTLPKDAVALINSST